jgi:hypothetical protein
MPEGFNRPEHALQEAYNARSPAEALSFALVAIRLQQQQIAELEKAVGVQDGRAMEGIRSRAKALIEQRDVFDAAGEAMANVINDGTLGQG